MGSHKSRPTKGQGILRSGASAYRLAAALGAEAPRVCKKICYPSRATAKVAIRRLRGAGRDREGDGWSLNAFWCPACESWHVGHSTPTRDRPRD